MRKGFLKVLTLLFLACSLLSAAGTVTQTVSKLGYSEIYLLTATWVGDASDGTVPATALATSGTTLASTEGLYIIQVQTIPGSPSPTTLYDIELRNAAAQDLVAGGCANRSATVAQFCTAFPARPISGATTLVLTGQSVNSATGQILIYLAREPGPAVAQTGTVTTSGTATVTGTVIATQDTPSSLNVQVQGNTPIGDAGPSKPVLIGGYGSGAISGAAQAGTICTQAAPITLTGSGNTEIVALTASRAIRICHVSLAAASAVGVKLTTGTGTNCATGTADVTGVYQNVTGLALDFGLSGLPVTSAQALCVNLSGAVNAGGVVLYAIY